MNQDSDKNENRRDGDKSRSFGRRDDGRPSKPAGGSTFRPRNGDTDRPRFSRDERPAGAGPRRERGGEDRPWSRDERPTRTGQSPFASRDRQDSNRSRPDRPSSPPRPSFGRDRADSDRNRSNDSRPRFGRDDKPRFPRNESPRTGADSRDEKPRVNRDTDRPPSTDSDQRRSRFNADRTSDRPTDRPRFERRNDTGRGRPDDARPRFSRDSNDRSRPSSGGRGRADKPGGSPDRFKRVGGFSRDADDRNRENWSDPDKHGPRTAGDATERSQDTGSRDARPRSDRPEGRSDQGRGKEPQGGEFNSRNTRFTPEQRKDSGERRTGFFVKAPNYELEQQRRAGQINAPRTPRPRTDKYENVAPKSRSNTNEQAEKPVPAGEPGTTRLNRYIANSGVCSRREADELIARGDITVNGKVVTEMGFRVKEGDMVKYGTKALTPERFVYVLLNKPKDYITTTEDPEERKTVMELVADAGNFRMYPVGRLDRKTTGLLLLTNDGELADKLTHPSNEARKIYQVELDKPITEEHFDALKKGIELEDGPIKPDALSIVTPDAYVVGIEIHSGRNRIVRRMFESLGYEVTKLDRTAYAGLTKKELPRGKWRFLDPKEVVKLKYLS